MLKYINPQLRRDITTGDRFEGHHNRGGQQNNERRKYCLRTVYRKEKAMRHGQMQRRRRKSVWGEVRYKNSLEEMVARHEEGFLEPW